MQSVVREEKQQQQALVKLTFWNVNSAVEQKQFASCDDPEAGSSICKEGDFDMFKTHTALELVFLGGTVVFHFNWKITLFTGIIFEAGRQGLQSRQLATLTL